MPEEKKVQVIEVDCSKIKELLEKVYEHDLEIRKDWKISKEDEIVDFHNLEIVVNILEKCGMPSKSVVGSDGLKAIFLAIHHHKTNFYSKKYLPLFKKAAERGEFDQSTIALLVDRILMNDNLPQIYGTQVMGNSLYKLSDPENVNRRRDSVGLEPIEIYLRRFNIEFKVAQKK